MRKVFFIASFLFLVSCSVHKDIQIKEKPSDLYKAQKDNEKKSLEIVQKIFTSTDPVSAENIKKVENELKIMVANARSNQILMRMIPYVEKGDVNAYELATIEVDYGIDDLDSVVQRTGLRMFANDIRKGVLKFPWQLKCGKYDKRIIHMCFEYGIFEPSLVTYFDRGRDDPKKVDIFDDGGLSASIQFANVYIPWRFGRSEFFDKWHWGPSFGIGISAAANDATEAEEGESEVKSSNAPVVVASWGMKMQYTLSSNVNFGLEVGRAKGFTSDESFADSSDDANFVGLTIKFNTGKSE